MQVRRTTSPSVEYSILAPPTLALTAGYTLEQAEGLVQVICHALQGAVTPIERSVLSQRDLVSHGDGQDFLMNLSYPRT